MSLICPAPDKNNVEESDLLTELNELDNSSNKEVLRKTAGTIINYELLDTDNTLSADSDLICPTQKAVKTYIDNQIGNENLWDRDTVNGYTYLHNNTDKVGIGITTPTALLHIKAGTTTVAPIKFTSGPLLTTPQAGAIEYYSDRFYITNINTQRAIDRTSDVIISTVEVTDTTTETTLFTALIPANTAKVGNVLKSEAYGVITTNSASDYCTIRIKAGGVTIATIINPGRLLTDECWEIKAIATVRSTGETGSVAMKIRMVLNDSTTDHCEVETLDLTKSENITITAQWNNADAGNTISIQQGYMEYKN